MATLTKATRVFKMGSVELADPDPSMTPEKVVKQLKNASLSSPSLESGRLVFTIELPPVKTKG